MRLNQANSKGFGVLGDIGSETKGTKAITSNLAYDKYQGMVAYGTERGHIQIMTLTGQTLQIYNAHRNAKIEHVLLVPLPA